MTKEAYSAKNSFYNAVNLDYGDEFDMEPFPRFPHISAEEAAANFMRVVEARQTVIPLYEHTPSEHTVQTGD